MMNEVDDVQAKLAKFERQYKLEYINSDTMAAILTIEKHKNIIFNNIDSKSLLTRRKKTFNFLKRNYPNMDVRVINKKLSSEFFIGYLGTLLSFIFGEYFCLFLFYMLLGSFFGYSSAGAIVPTVIIGVIIFFGIMIWMMWTDIHD